MKNERLFEEIHRKAQLREAKISEQHLEENEHAVALHLIEGNLHDLFESISNDLAKAPKKLRERVLTSCATILSNGMDLGKIGVDKDEWLFKFRSYYLKN